MTKARILVWAGILSACPACQQPIHLLGQDFLDVIPAVMIPNGCGGIIAQAFEVRTLVNRPAQTAAEAPDGRLSPGLAAEVRPFPRC